MSSHVPRYVFLDAALLGDNFKAIFAVRVTRHRQQFVTFRHSFILPDDTERHIQKPDVAFHSGFLAVGLYPQMARQMKSVNFPLSDYTYL